MSWWEAVERGDVAELRRQIDAGADVDAADAEITAEMAKRIKRFADFVGEDYVEGEKLGRTALMHAAAAGHSKVVQLLLDAGADVRKKDALGRTPLMLAVQGGHSDVAERLIAAKSDMDAKDVFGTPALTMAIQAEHKDLARRLLAVGAKADPNVKRSAKPLMAAVDQGEVALVRELLQAGASIKVRGLLESAVTNCNGELVQLLIDHGADIREKTETGDTLLGWAILSASEEGNTEAVEVLLRAEASVPEAEAAGDSVLMMPMVQGQLDLMRRLIEAGADVNKPINEEGETLLMRACDRMWGSKQMALFLINAGADLEAKDNEDRTALNIADEQGTKAVAKLLRTVGAKEHTPAARPEDEDEEGDGYEDPLSRIALPQRRGVAQEQSGESWDSLLVRGSIDEVGDALGRDPDVASVERDVFGKKLDREKGDLLILAQIKGHAWTLVSTTRSPDDLCEWLSKATGRRVMRTGYQDTAGVTYFLMYEDGQSIEQFQSMGDEFGTDDDYDEDEEFDVHRGGPEHIDVRAFGSEEEVVQHLVRREDAYVPIFYGWQGEDGRLELFAWAEDAVQRKNLVRVDLVRFKPTAEQARRKKPDKVTEQLLDAIRKGKLKGVSKAIAAGADVSILPESLRYTPLGLSVSSMHGTDDTRDMPAIIEALVKAGADVNDGGAEPTLVQNAEALHLDEKHRLPLMKLLLDLGADVNARNGQGKTALMYAAGYGCLQTVRFLLQTGADHRLQDEHGLTARQAAESAYKWLKKPEVKAVADYLAEIEVGRTDVEPIDVDEAAAQMEDKAAQMRESMGEIFSSLKELGKLMEQPEEDDEPDALEEAVSGMPRRITLEPDDEIDWNDPKRLRSKAKVLASLGFQEIGAFTIPRLPGNKLLAMFHSNQAAYAVIYEHDQAGQWVDLVRRFEDGSQVTYTNAPSNIMFDRPGDRKVHLRKADVRELYDRLVAEVAEASKAMPVRADLFQEAFERSYAREMDWLADRARSG